MLLFAVTRYCTVFMTDMETAYQSWQKMLDGGAQMIYPAHGNAFPASRLKEHMGQILTRDLLPFFLSCTTLFYRFGLNEYSQIGLVEWLWRTLTYGKALRMKKQSA